MDGWLTCWIRFMLMVVAQAIAIPTASTGAITHGEYEVFAVVGAVILDFWWHTEMPT